MYAHMHVVMLHDAQKHHNCHGIIHYSIKVMMMSF